MDMIMNDDKVCHCSHNELKAEACMLQETSRPLQDAAPLQEGQRQNAVNKNKKNPLGIS